MRFVLLLLNILTLNVCLSIANSNIVHMIHDVIGSYDQPTSVVANICMKSVYKLKLAKILGEENQISITFSSQNEIMKRRVRDNHLFFIIDTGCPSYKSFLYQAGAQRMFSKTYRWLLLGKVDDIINELTDLTILVDSEFIVAEEQENGDFILQAVYKIKPGSQWIKEYYGSWTAGSGFNESRGRLISNAMRRKDLKGNAIVTSTVITDNRTRYNLADLTNTFIDPITKSTFHAINNLYEFLNATRSFHFTDSWGHPVKGNWSGMFGDMHKGKADLCGTISFMNKERLDVIEYITIPGVTSMSKIVFRQPPLSYQFNLFTLPFTTGVWYCLGGFIVILTIILYLNAKWDIHKCQDYEQKTIDQTFLGATWSDIVIFVVSAVSQQGSSNELKGTLGRLVMFLVFLAFLFFYTSYSASIVVLLQSTSNEIRTVTDLSNSKLEFGIEDVVYHKHYFSVSGQGAPDANYIIGYLTVFKAIISPNWTNTSSKIMTILPLYLLTADYARDPIRKAFYETKVSPKGYKPNYMSLEEGVRKLQTKPFAFNMNIGTGYRIVSQYFQEHEKCGLREIDYIQGRKPWFCSKKDSPYTEMYRIGLFRTEEHGLNTRNNRLIFVKKPLCTVTSGNFQSVKMVDFYPVLLMLIYGVILAFALLLFEILLHRRMKTKDN